MTQDVGAFAITVDDGTTPGQHLNYAAADEKILGWRLMSQIMFQVEPPFVCQRLCSESFKISVVKD